MGKKRSRDRFESVYSTPGFTEEQLKLMGTYESFNYMPNDSSVYRQWLQRQPYRLDWDRWLVMVLIGLSAGCLGFLMHQFTILVSNVKWKQTRHFIESGDWTGAWCFNTGVSVLLTALSAGLVTFICPEAGSSGVPEVMAYLNGVDVPRYFTLKTFVVKFIACVAAVGANMPAGPEGPMIHLGAMLGEGISQFRSRALRFSLPFFSRLRNPQDRRNFLNAGAGAGFAAAFESPLGGVLFALEEISSFWSMKLAWMTFFCCGLAGIVAYVLNSGHEIGFKHKDDLGVLDVNKFIEFKNSGKTLPVHIYMFVPAMLLGVIGGLLGALFCALNIQIGRLRKRIVRKLRYKALQKTFLFTEPIVISVIWMSFSLFIPMMYPCKPQHVCEYKIGCNGSESAVPDAYSTCVDHNLRSFTCRKPFNYNESTLLVEGEYNQVASLLHIHISYAIVFLFSRETYNQFSYESLLPVLGVYFFLACWTSGTAIAGGIVLPKLFIGGLYGRAIGLVLVKLHGDFISDHHWQWLDPGIWAFIGAASFFGGVSRLTISLTAIMIEITNDIRFLLPVMSTLLLARIVGGSLTQSFYHCQIVFKCLPFIGDEEPIVYDKAGKLIQLELFNAGDVMMAPVRTVTPIVSLGTLSKLLHDTRHCGFPVVKRDDVSRLEVLYGMVHRNELNVILTHPQIRAVVQPGSTINANIKYEEIDINPMSRKIPMKDILENYRTNPLYESISIDLEPYINHSTPSVAHNYSLYRMYILFRSFGMRHLVILDANNCVVGIVTRKDLMGFNVQRKLEPLLDARRNLNASNSQRRSAFTPYSVT